MRKPCSSPCSQSQRRDQACKGNATYVFNSSLAVRALSRRHAINHAAIPLKPTIGCITNSNEHRQRDSNINVLESDVHFDTDESCLPVQSLAIRYPRCFAVGRQQQSNADITS